MDPTTVARTNDTSNQAYGGTYTYDNNGRVTWAINDKQKISGWYAYQYKVDPHWLIQIFNASPEAVAHHHLAHAALDDQVDLHGHQQAAVRGRRRRGREPRHDQARSRSGGHCVRARDRWRRDASRSRSRRPGNFSYRAPTGFDFDDRLPSQTFNAAMSYVTGSHNFKFGFEMQRGHFWRGDNNDSTGGIWYTTTAACPHFVTHSGAGRPGGRTT